MRSIDKIIVPEHFSFPARDGDNTERPHIRIYNTSRTATVYLRKK